MLSSFERMPWAACLFTQEGIFMNDEILRCFIVIAEENDIGKAATRAGPVEQVLASDPVYQQACLEKTQ